MNTASVESAIALLLATNAKEQAAIDSKRVEVTVIRNGVKPETAASKKKGPSKAPIQQKSVGANIKVQGLFLMEKGSLGPVGFLRAMKDAGRRPFEATLPNGEKRTVIKIDPSKVRDDQVMAIAAYNGWDPSKNFGEQEVFARMAANREIALSNGAKPEQGDSIVATRRAVNRSLSGYVNGMPDHTQRAIANLTAQERETVEALVEHNRSQVRDQAWLANAAIIEAKLVSIRAQLAQYVP